MTLGSIPESRNPDPDPKNPDPDPENPDFPDFFFLLLWTPLDLRVDPRWSLTVSGPPGTLQRPPKGKVELG